MLQKIKGVLTSEAFKKRLKSFFWRVGSMLGVYFVGEAVKEVSAFDLPTTATVIIGLIAGEITKALNNIAQSEARSYEEGN